MLFSGLDRYRDEGLLLLRVGIGLAFMGHGLPKLLGGPERWAAIAEFVGIGIVPTFFGFMAGISEFGGGLLLVLGLFTRPALALLFCTMVGAVVAHIGAGDGFTELSHALEAAILFLSLLFIGPGRHSLDARLHERTGTVEEYA